MLLGDFYVFLYFPVSDIVTFTIHPIMLTPQSVIEVDGSVVKPSSKISTSTASPFPPTGRPPHSMDIDKLFKVRQCSHTRGSTEPNGQVPKLPTGGNKRRMPDAPTPDMIKRARVDEEDSETRHSDPPPGPRKATVEDVDEDGDTRMEDDEFAPGNDADYFAEEDDEGRFFGGGLTSEQKDILNIFDQAGGEGVQADVSPGHCRLLILMFKTHF